MSATASSVQPKIIWEPSPKQIEYLAAPEQEVLYGGAAGGGKSDSLLIDALGLNQQATNYSSYRAILFRKTYPELTDLVDRSRELYTQIVPGAYYNTQEKEWRFPSGAKIRFGYLDHVQDRYRYQGQAFQFIGFDELTQHETDIGYKYLISRLRGVETSLKWYVRATCNPGGFGHAWVKDRFQIPDEGTAVQFVVDLPDPKTGGTRQWHRRFIPARVTDNPYLAGTEYESQLHLLSDMEKRALLDGRWDVAEIIGAIYQDELNDAHMNGRVLNIPIETTYPVYTFWDLGRNDQTAVWMMQYIGMEKRFIGYRAESFKTITWWGTELRKWAEQKNVRFEEHFMPHDVTVQQLSLNNESRKSMFERVGITPITVVPRIEQLEEGIEITRQFLTTCYFDRAGCAEGLKALANYRRKLDEANDTYSRIPLHNWACLEGDTKLITTEGICKISTLKSTGMVLTRCGWKRYENPHVTRHAQLVEVVFDDGYTVNCTEDHRFLTESGWTFARDLTNCSVILSASIPSRSTIRESSTVSLHKTSTLRVAAGCYIGTFGRLCLETYRKAATYITGMETDRTTALQTLNVCLSVNTPYYRGHNDNRAMKDGSLQRLGSQLQIGIRAMQGDSGISAKRTGRSRGRNGSARTSLAKFAALLSRTLLSGRAETVPSTAQYPANQKRIASVRRLNRSADVWCITVPEVGEYALANGAIVHNSNGSDAFRQAAQSWLQPSARNTTAYEPAPDPGY